MEIPNTILESMLRSYPELEPISEDIRSAYLLLVKCYDLGGTVLCCGNGGSAADADHIVGELMKGFRLKRPLSGSIARLFSGTPESRRLAASLQNPLPAISLTGQAALLSAFANDVSPDMVYAQQVLGYGAGRTALLIALSTSGSSANIVQAVETASCLEIPSIAITGAAGGRLKNLATLCLRIPADETFRVQEYTLPVYHALCAMVEAHYFAAKEPCGSADANPVE